MQAERLRVPGLRWRNGKPMWRASKPAIAAGYPSKSANLAFLADDHEALTTRCKRLQREMLDYLTDPDRRALKSFRVKRPAMWSKVGHIYFVECDGMIKIGFTTDLNGRVLQLQNSTLQTITLLGTIPGTPEIEKFLHWQFRNFHHRGEWFRVDKPTMEFVQTHLLIGNTHGTTVRRRFRRAAHAINRGDEILISG